MPYKESTFRGWQLLCVLLVTFPPSKNFEPYLHTFLSQHSSITEGYVDVLAKHLTAKAKVDQDGIGMLPRSYTCASIWI
jgi:Rho GTPase-activating protein 39